MPVRIHRILSIGMAAVLLGLVGCGKETDNTGKEGEKPAPLAQKIDNAGKPISAQPVSRPGTQENAAGQPILLPFAQAVLLDPPNDDEMIPPNKGCNGKNTIKIFEAIRDDLWNKVVFQNAAGKRIRYSAVMVTELGEIEVDLLGDVAPNHVRNFVCLARSQFFDGMKFYKSLNAMIEDNKVAYIETGCPRGTGERYSGSIGYWLKPEISDQATHEEGVIGAYRDLEDPNTAACRFYITAAKMPHMDGYYTVFGRVTRGLDIVRTINKRAVENDDRLVEPVLIRSVTIRSNLE